MQVQNGTGPGIWRSKRPLVASRQEKQEIVHTLIPINNWHRKELGCFHIIFAQILTAHNFCLTHITASILIYANALGYFLSIKIEFVMRNLISIFLCCCIWKGGFKKCDFQKIEKEK